jgi:16S rRNA (guanine527-N7)-methyltransferase
VEQSPPSVRSQITADRLAAFEALVRKWNPAINLVSKGSLAEFTTRHVADSVQLFDFAGVAEGHWVDLGSGGGFPGLVVAILAAEAAPALRVTCIESDHRKAAFLATAARELGLGVGVLAERIEAAEPQAARAVSARALAPLPELLPMAARHLAPGGAALFLKGARWAMEVTEAREHWQFELVDAPSRTEERGRLLKLRKIARA